MKANGEKGVEVEMTGYLGEIWKCRWFWISLAWLDLRKRYRSSLLGPAWAFVQPVIMALLFCLVFCGAFRADFRQHFPYVLVGLSFWGYFTHAIQEGCSCLYWSETYILHHRAPLAVYPLRIVLSSGFHFLLVILPVWLASWTVGGFFRPGVFLALLGVFLLLFILLWSLATILSITTIYFYDIRYLTDIGLQILFYITPIIYRPALLYNRGLGFLVQANPLAALADCLRGPILEGTMPAPISWCVGISTTCGVFFLALWTLKKFERRIIFQL